MDVIEEVGSGLVREGVGRLWAKPSPRALSLALAIGGVAILLALVLVVGLVSRDPTWTAGAAALATMLVIAYQSWETRRSTAVAERSVLLTEALAAEAEKARLDQRAPRIAVRIAEQPAWPPLRARQFVGQEAPSFKEGEVFRLPGASSMQIDLSAEGTVTNEGEGSVDVELIGLRLHEDDKWTEPCQCRRALPPGATIPFRLESGRPVAEWAENAKAREEKRPLPYAIAGLVTVDDSFDNGVDDTWTILITGVPLEPVPDRRTPGGSRE